MGSLKFSMFDEHCMRRALVLARRGEGSVEPNPMVGCVLARDGKIISEGYHHRFGGPHAEIEALRRIRNQAKGATAYVTLEPCCHVGKTPPCTDALIEAEVSRVVAAIQDPFPQVAGRGLASLKSQGIKTQVGLCRGEAELLLGPYLKRLDEKLPYVILKWAQSLDGKIATRSGDSRWISSHSSRRLVHLLRARVDAIMVGVGTVSADDPRLTAREVPIKRTATRVVVDSRLRTPPTALLLRNAGRIPVLIASTHASMAREPRKVLALQRRGAIVQPFAGRPGRVALRPLLRFLAKQGATNVLVEGGGKLLSSFLDSELADEAWVFVAPLLIGGDSAPAAYAGVGRGVVSDALRPTAVSTRRIGPDTLFRLRL